MPALNIELAAPNPDVQLVMIGSHEALGWWDPGKGCKLEWNGDSWCTPKPVVLDGGLGVSRGQHHRPASVDYKFVRVIQGQCMWECGPNRVLDIPAGTTDCMVHAEFNGKGIVKLGPPPAKKSRDAEGSAEVEVAAAEVAKWAQEEKKAVMTEEVLRQQLGELQAEIRRNRARVQQALQVKEKTLAEIAADTERRLASVPVPLDEDSSPPSKNASPRGVSSDKVAFSPVAADDRREQAKSPTERGEVAASGTPAPVASAAWQMNIKTDVQELKCSAHRLTSPSAQVMQPMPERHEEPKTSAQAIVSPSAQDVKSPAKAMGSPPAKDLKSSEQATASSLQPPPPQDPPSCVQRMASPPAEDLKCSAEEAASPRSQESASKEGRQMQDSISESTAPQSIASDPVEDHKAQAMPTTKATEEDLAPSAPEARTTLFVTAEGDDGVGCHQILDAKEESADIVDLEQTKGMQELEAPAPDKVLDVHCSPELPKASVKSEDSDANRSLAQPLVADAGDGEEEISVLKAEMSLNHSETTCTTTASASFIESGGVVSLPRSSLPSSVSPSQSHSPWQSTSDAASRGSDSGAPEGCKSPLVEDGFDENVGMMCQGHGDDQQARSTSTSQPASRRRRQQLRKTFERGQRTVLDSRPGKGKKGAAACEDRTSGAQKCAESETDNVEESSSGREGASLENIIVKDGSNDWALECLASARHRWHYIGDDPNDVPELPLDTEVLTGEVPALLRELRRLQHGFDEEANAAAMAEAMAVAKQEELGRLHQTCTEAQEEVCHLRGNLASVEVSLSMERLETADLKEEVERLLADVKDREDKTAEAERQIARLQDDVEQAKKATAEELNLREESCAKLNEEIARLGGDLDAMRNAYLMQVQRNTTLQASMDECMQELREWQSRGLAADAEASQERDMAYAELRTVKDQLEEKISLADADADEISRLREEVKSQQWEIEALKQSGERAADAESRACHLQEELLEMQKAAVTEAGIHEQECAQKDEELNRLAGDLEVTREAYDAQVLRGDTLQANLDVYLQELQGWHHKSFACDAEALLQRDNALAALEAAKEQLAERASQAAADAAEIARLRKELEEQRASSKPSRAAEPQSRSAPSPASSKGSFGSTTMSLFRPVAMTRETRQEVVRHHNGSGCSTPSQSSSRTSRWKDVPVEADPESQDPVTTDAAELALAWMLTAETPTASGGNESDEISGASGGWSRGTSSTGPEEQSSVSGTDGEGGLLKQKPNKPPPVPERRVAPQLRQRLYRPGMIAGQQGQGVSCP